MDCFLFEGLRDDEISKVYGLLGDIVTAKKGDELYKNGCICIIKSGQAIIKRKSAGENEITVKSIGNGGVFGAASVFGEWREGLSSVTATEKCELYYANEDILRKIFIKYPTVSFNYITFLSDRIRFLNGRIDTFVAQSTAEKLYEYLLSLCDENSRVNLDFSMSELARRLNVGRSSLYRDITVLEKNGLITRKSKTFIINR